MAAETFRIEIPIHVEDKTDPGVSQATRKVNGFDKANQKTQERLNQMNRTKYQVVLDALDRASGIIGGVSSKARSIAGKTFSFTMKVVDMATAPLKALWNFATSIQGAILGATGAFAGIYKPMDIAGDYEQTQIAFETMLKSGEKANKFLQEASAFANKTPFEFPELINSSKLLLAFGFDAKDVLSTLSTIGDAASGLGAGSEGIDRITRALGQMKAKGRVQAEELLQLQEMGVPANQILQEELGLTADQVANIGKEGIESGKAIDALLRGMDKRYGGMMQNQSKTAKGMISTIKDTLSNGLLRPWGQGLWEGVKPGLEKITTWIDENQDTLAAWGEAWKEAGANISKWVMSKVEDLQGSIKKMTNSQEWKDAKSFGEKMKIAWNTIIAEPFNEWWNSTGKAWLADKASKIGAGLGSGITMGLLALLGIDVSSATQDGKSVGGAFIQGFKNGFDTEKITEALKTWADNNKEIVVGLGVIIGAKLVAGIIKGLGKLNELKNLFGKGSKSSTSAMQMPSSYATTTMTVTASVVYVNGPVVSGGGASGGKVPSIAPIPSLPGGGSATIPKLPGGGSTLALPGAVGAASKAYTVYAPTAAKGTSVVMGTTGSAVTAGLANTGYAMGSGAATIGGAAAAGALGSAGIIGGAIGVGSGLYDIYKGAKSDDSKKAKDKYFSGGSKIGMVAAGAGIGAAVGSVVPVIGTGIGAAVGAGVGGVSALLAGDKAGKALSDSSDSGGWLSNAGKAMGGFFTETLPKGWNSFWGGVGDFFTTSVPNWWGGLTDKVSSFFTETIPEKWGEFWDGVGDFFTETVPYALGYAAGKIEVFFTEDIPEFFGTLWDGLSTFFTSTLPTWASDVWNGSIIPFFTQDIPNFFGNLWGGITTFFTATLPTWAADVWGNNIVPFFTQDIPNFFGGLWTGVTTFFTATLPTWAANTWNNNILPFFTQTIPGFFGSLWSSVSGFFTQTLPTLASSVWGSIKSFFTDMIPSFFGSLWDKVKGSFGAGYNAGKGGSTQAHAYGGIMTQPHMGIVAEDGAEGIIPLSPSKRGRGIDLWQRTGELLGVRPYADGGIVGDEPEDIPTAAPTGQSGQGVTIKIEVKAEPKFVIEGGDSADEGKILAILKAYIREMTDDIGDELAERLARIFANMPVKGGAGA